MTAETEDAAPGVSDWGGAVDRYADLARWVATAFGVVGLAAIGVIPAAALADDRPDDLGTVAGGGAIALAGALIAVVAVVVAQEPRLVDARDLRPAARSRIARRFRGTAGIEHQIHSHPDRFLPPGLTSPADLDVAIDNLRDLHRSGQTDPAVSDAAVAGYAQVLTSYRAARDNLSGLARYDLARSRFSSAMAVVVVAAVAAFAGLGVAGLGLARSASDDAPAVEVEEVSVRLTAEGRDTLAPVLGRRCVDEEVPVALIGGDRTTSTWDVVTTGAGPCAVARFTLTSELGTIV